LIFTIGVTISTKLTYLSKRAEKIIYKFDRIYIFVSSFIYSIKSQKHLEQLSQIDFLSGKMLLYILVGFGAQLIDGTLGMAYGVSSNTFLLSIGLNPAAASASVHLAEVFTSGVSAISHFSFKNIHKRLFLALLIPGVIGGAVGAVLLSVFDGNMLKPFVSFYLLIMGIVILKKGISANGARTKVKRISWLALLGGFLDAVGGGGWGPIVNSTLLSKGKHPRLVIGTVNSVEFFVAAASAGVFTVMLGIQHLETVVGLILGGMLAAPVGAFLVSKVKPKILLVMVGALICFLSLKNLLIFLR
jgi:uncharacterized membrane protein YfcA